MNIKLLQKYVDDELVSCRKHPTEDLYIYNYTPKVQFEKLWDEITLNCRGLIIDSNNNIISKPFGKFFNIEEINVSDIPNLPFDVFEKLDGSLGVLYKVNNKPFIATRGSFDSEQAIHANEILYSKYSHTFDKIKDGYTYLFEIIYPENRIVVNYKDKDDITLLTIINNETSQEHIENIGFPIVKKYDNLKNINELKSLEEENREGFVIRFNNSFRMKVKFEWYVKLHRVLSGVSNIMIWEALRDKKDISDILDMVPDEIYDWIKVIEKDLKDKYNDILKECEKAFKVLETRKDTALYFKTQKYPHVLFSMLGGGYNTNMIIWKTIKPDKKKYCFG